jgi:uncharacterized membrane protein (Fun14 family)
MLMPKTMGGLTGWSGDGPWRSKSVLVALVLAVIGLGLWFADIRNGPPQGEANNVAASGPAGSHWDWSKPFPIYARLSVSYVAGFCIGWLFRKLMRLILVAGALAIAVLAYGKLTGCDLTHTQLQVKRRSEWARHEATAGENYLRHLLPSAAGGGAGAFLGFRRRNKTPVSNAPGA